MKPKEYPSLVRAISDGARRAVSRAFKYEETIDEEYLLATIEECMLSEICEAFEFEDKQE